MKKIKITLLSYIALLISATYCFGAIPYSKDIVECMTTAEAYPAWGNLLNIMNTTLFLMIPMTIVFCTSNIYNILKDKKSKPVNYINDLTALTIISSIVCGILLGNNIGYYGIGNIVYFLVMAISIITTSLVVKKINKSIDKNESHIKNKILKLIFIILTLALMAILFINLGYNY